MKRAFTLIELLVVSSIISFLSSVVLASLQDARVKATDASKVTTVRSVNTSIQLYKSNTDSVPKNYNIDGTFSPGGGGNQPACENSTGDGSDLAYKQSVGQLVSANVLPMIPKSPDDRPYCYFDYDASNPASDGAGASFFTTLRDGSVYPPAGTLGSGIGGGGGGGGGGNTSIRIVGQLEMEEFVGDGVIPPHTRSTTFVATDSNGNLLKTWQIDLANSSGSIFDYTLNDAPTNATNLSAKTNWSLRRRLPVSFVGYQANVNFTGGNMLLGGDFTGDNLINTPDYAILRSGWLTDDPAGDVNGDGRDSTIDYLILRNNFYKTGDPQ